MLLLKPYSLSLTLTNLADGISITYQNGTYHNPNNPHPPSPSPPHRSRYRLTSNEHDPKGRDGQVQIGRFATDILYEPLGLSVADVAAVEAIEEVEDGQEGEKDGVCFAVDSLSQSEQLLAGGLRVTDRDEGE